MSVLKEVCGYMGEGLRKLRWCRNIVSNHSSGFLRSLIYHEIEPQHEAAFLQQLQSINQYYRFVDINLFCQMHRGELPIGGGNILLTFDDGFKSNRIIAEKYLNPLGIKAVFFIIPEFVECRDDARQREFLVKNIFAGEKHNDEIPSTLKPMDWNDIQYLLDHGHTIASHSSTHQRLSAISCDDKLRYEVVESANILQRKLNVPIQYFAYPFGDVNSVNSEVMNLAKSRYQYIFSGVRGNNTAQVNSYAIRREHVEPTFSLKYFNFILEGGLSPRYYYKRKLLDKMV